MAALLGGAGLAYAVGLSRAWATAGRGRIVRVSQVRSFVAAQTVLAVALLSPLASAAHESLTAHMTQHVPLLVVAAPLLALGAPLPTVLWAFPTAWRERALGTWRVARRSHRSRWAVWVGAALVGQSIVMLAWHVPALYEASTRHRGPTRPPARELRDDGHRVRVGGRRGLLPPPGMAPPSPCCLPPPCPGACSVPG